MTEETKIDGRACDLEKSTKEMVLVQAYRDEPRGWLYRKAGTNNIPRPVMMWAVCKRIMIGDLTNLMRERTFYMEVRPVIDVGGGVLCVAPYDVELARAAEVAP